MIITWELKLFISTYVTNLDTEADISALVIASLWSIKITFFYCRVRNIQNATSLLFGNYARSYVRIIFNELRNHMPTLI